MVLYSNHWLRALKCCCDLKFHESDHMGIVSLLMFEFLQKPLNTHTVRGLL